jgi:hypothetical protein
MPGAPVLFDHHHGIGQSFLSAEQRMLAEMRERRWREDEARARAAWDEKIRRLRTGGR